MPRTNRETCSHPHQYATRSGLVCSRCGAYLGRLDELLRRPDRRTDSGLKVSPAAAPCPAVTASPSDSAQAVAD